MSSPLKQVLFRNPAGAGKVLAWGLSKQRGRSHILEKQMRVNTSFP
jgi:hypothetical protein